MNGDQFTSDALLSICGSKQPPLWAQVGKKNEWTMRLAERDNLIIDELCVHFNKGSDDSKDPIKDGLSFSFLK